MKTLRSSFRSTAPSSPWFCFETTTTTNKLLKRKKKRRKKKKQQTRTRRRKRPTCSRWWPSRWRRTGCCAPARRWRRCASRWQSPPMMMMPPPSVRSSSGRWSLLTGRSRWRWNERNRTSLSSITFWCRRRCSGATPACPGSSRWAPSRCAFSHIPICRPLVEVQLSPFVVVVFNFLFTTFLLSLQAFPPPATPPPGPSTAICWSSTTGKSLASTKNGWTSPVASFARTRSPLMMNPLFRCCAPRTPASSRPHHTWTSTATLGSSTTPSCFPFRRTLCRWTRWWGRCPRGRSGCLRSSRSGRHQARRWSTSPSAHWAPLMCRWWVALWRCSAELATGTSSPPVNGRVSTSTWCPPTAGAGPFCRRRGFSRWLIWWLHTVESKWKGKVK